MNDLRFALRQLLKNPGFTVVAVLTLALGIGSTSSVLTLIQGVLLTPPPYPRPDQIMLIRPTQTDGHPRPGGPPTEQWIGWQKENVSFEALAGYVWTFDYLLLPDGGEAISGLEVTTDYFNVIGIKPLLGRPFLDSEAIGNPRSASFIILSHDLWQRRFHGDPNILGQKVRLSRHPPLTIVGVMPAGVRSLPSFGEEGDPYYDVNAELDYWLPAAPDLSDPKGNSGDGPWSVVGRLRPGVAPARAQAELAAIAARLAKADKFYQGVSVKTERLTDFLNKDGGKLLLPLLGAVGLVFLIACANAAGFLLARGLRRQQEYALRCALGAQRARLFRQVLVETMLLALTGGVLGAMLSIVIVAVIKAFGGFAIPRLDSVAIGWPVLAFCFAAALIAAILAGLLPALRASRMNPVQAIKATGPATSTARNERRLLGGVAILQTALTLALLTGAGLLVRTVVNLARVRPGYDTQHLLTMNVMRDNSDGVGDFHERALERVSAIPGVREAAFVWGLPLTGNKWMNDGIKIGGQVDQTKLADKLPVAIYSVTPAYFNAMNLDLVEGREFRTDDNTANWKNWLEPAAGEKPCICIINQSMADRFFPNVNPIGRKLITWPWPKRPKEIVGVVANSRTEALTQNADPAVYLPFFQNYPFAKHLVVRAASDPASLAAAVQRELRAVEPTVAIDHVETMEQIRSQSVASQTFAMRMLVAFSLVGSVLALGGIYGVLSLSVASRKREIAIRMAVGAERSNVLGLVLTEGLKLIAVGLAIGAGIALVLGWMLRTFLFGVEPTDPITLVIVALLFAAVALLASWWPARTAASVDPMEALRHE